MSCSSGGTRRVVVAISFFQVPVLLSNLTEFLPTTSLDQFRKRNSSKAFWHQCGYQGSGGINLIISHAFGSLIHCRGIYL